MTDRTSVRRLADALCAPTRRNPAEDWRSLDGLPSPGLYAWFVDESGADDLAKALGESVTPGLIC